MTNVKGSIAESGSTPAMSVDTLGPRPAPPAQQRTANMAPLLRDIDWNGHIPSAPRGPVGMNRAEVSAQLAASDDDERWLPQLPGPRRSPDAPKPKVPGQRPAATLGYGTPAYLTAFGAA